MTSNHDRGAVARLTRIGGLGAIVAGMLLGAANIVQTVLGSGNTAALAYADRIASELYFAGSIALIIGLVGLYLYQSESAGKFGLVAFLMALAGSAMMLSSDWDELFMLPFLVSKGITEPPSLLITGIGFLMNFAFYALGLLLFAAATYRARVLPRLSAILLASGIILGFTRGLDILLPTYIALVWMGVVVVRGQARHSSTQRVAIFHPTQTGQAEHGVAQPEII